MLLTRIVRLFCMPAILCFSFTNDAEAQQVSSITRLSVSPANEGGNAESSRIASSINSQITAFESRASNLVQSDENFSSDIFARNAANGATIRISTGPGNTEADDSSFNPDVSAVAPNGFYAIAFESDATNLIRFTALPDNNNRRDIFVSFPAIGFLERASFGAGFTQANGDSFNPSIAIAPDPNRVFVAYESDADNLILSDLNNRRDIFLTAISEPADLNNFNPQSAISTIRVSRGSGNSEPNGDSFAPSISGNGRFIVFESEATNLVPGAVPQVKQIYLYDTVSQTTSLISRNAAGAPGDNDSSSPSISYNGSFIVYLSAATNLLNDGKTASSSTLQVIRHEIKTGENIRVNASSDGTPGDSTSSVNMGAKISPNGRFVAFSDESGNLVQNDTNSNSDVFIKDLTNGAIALVSRESGGGSSDGFSRFPDLSGASYNASTAILPFSSSSSDLVPGDTEGRIDTFTAQVSVPNRPLAKGTNPEVPPDLSVSGKKISLTFEKFSGVDLKKKKAKAGSTLSAKKPKPSVRYLAQVFKENEKNLKKKKVAEKLSKRNTLAFKNLKPGIYTVSYQTRIMRGDKVASRSLPSPEQRFRVQ